MESFFNGSEIRDSILLDLRKKIIDEKKNVQLAVVIAGDNPVCEKYVALKQNIADNLGVFFCLYRFNKADKTADIVESIKFLNDDEEIDGIMVQIPVDPEFDRDELIRAISPKKDIDGLRFCLGLDSVFRPPVVLAILEALRRSQKELKDSKILIIGKGFLVGDPLFRTLKEMGVSSTVADNSTKNLKELALKSDIIISAVGKADIVTVDMVKPHAVLIDAGTTEQNGTLRGDIDPIAFKESDYYTPVPGGIGPVTIAMLFKNLIK